jgi:indole-3-glycerol phosphate synthase
MTVISMGGLRTAEDVAYVHQAGIDAIVVGQALLTVPDTAKAISELFKLTYS